VTMPPDAITVESPSPARRARLSRGSQRDQWPWRSFYAASRFRLIEGYPEPPDSLEVLKTDHQDPSKAYRQALDGLAPALRDTRIRPQRAGSFRLVSAYPSSS